MKVFSLTISLHCQCCQVKLSGSEPLSLISMLSGVWLLHSEGYLHIDQKFKSRVGREYIPSSLFSCSLSARNFYERLNQTKWRIFRDYFMTIIKYHITGHCCGSMWLHCSIPTWWFWICQQLCWSSRRRKHPGHHRWFSLAPTERTLWKLIK